MSVKDGPGEGSWSVFAEKVVSERDDLRASRDHWKARAEDAERKLAEKTPLMEEMATLMHGEPLRELVEGLVQEAVAAEREACAVMVERWHFKRGGYTEMAFHIRARGNGAPDLATHGPKEETRSVRISKEQAASALTRLAKKQEEGDND